MGNIYNQITSSYYSQIVHQKNFAKGVTIFITGEGILLMQNKLVKKSNTIKIVVE